MEVTFEIKGLEQVKQALAILPHNIARRVLRKSVARAAKFAADQISLGTPVRDGNAIKKTSKGKVRKPGFLFRNIKAKYSKKYSTPMSVHYIVGGLGQGFYGHFIEGGHAIVRGKSQVRERKRNLRKGLRGWASGYAPPHPFIAPGFNRSHIQVQQVLVNELSNGILDEGARAGFKKSYGWYFG